MSGKSLQLKLESNDRVSEVNRYYSSVLGEGYEILLEDRFLHSEVQDIINEGGFAVREMYHEKSKTVAVIFQRQTLIEYYDGKLPHIL